MHFYMRKLKYKSNTLKCEDREIKFIIGVGVSTSWITETDKYNEYGRTIRKKYISFS